MRGALKFSFRLMALGAIGMWEPMWMPGAGLMLMAAALSDLPENWNSPVWK